MIHVSGTVTTRPSADGYNEIIATGVGVGAHTLLVRQLGVLRERPGQVPLGRIDLVVYCGTAASDQRLDAWLHAFVPPAIVEATRATMAALYREMRDGDAPHWTSVSELRRLGTPSGVAALRVAVWLLHALVGVAEHAHRPVLRVLLACDQGVERSLLLFNVWSYALTRASPAGAATWQPLTRRYSLSMAHWLQSGDPELLRLLESLAGVLPAQWQRLGQ
jgi:hypothetical protein